MIYKMSTVESPHPQTVATLLQESDIFLSEEAEISRYGNTGWQRKLHTVKRFFITFIASCFPPQTFFISFHAEIKSKYQYRVLPSPL